MKTSEDMRIEYHKAIIEGIKENSKAIHEQKAQVLAVEYKGLFDFAAAAIRGIFILNGSAAVAIVYNLRYLKDNEADGSLIYVAIGAMLAVFCSGIMCVAQRCYFNADNKNFRRSLDYYSKLIEHFEKINAERCEENFPSPPRYEKSWIGYALFIIAATLWGLSLCLFSYAAWNFPYEIYQIVAV